MLSTSTIYEESNLGLEFDCSQEATLVKPLIDFKVPFGSYRGGGGSARQIADKLENTKITISLKVLLQLILKYAYTLDILILQFVYITFFDGTLPIFQNF